MSAEIVVLLFHVNTTAYGIPLSVTYRILYTFDFIKYTDYVGFRKSYSLVVEIITDKEQQPTVGSAQCYDFSPTQLMYIDKL